MIKVLVADSSPGDIDTLTAILGADPEIEVIAVAATGAQAMDLVSKLRPDIVAISDSLDGAESEAYAAVIRQIMAYNPTPILILTDPDQAKVETRHAVSLHKATSMGALDVIEKPTRETAHALRAKGFVEAVKLLSKVKVVTHLAGKLEGRKRYPPVKPGVLDAGCRIPDTGYRHLASGIRKVVAIAASTGGPSALAEVLRGLPAGLAIGIVIVQHVAEGFSAGLAEWLDRESQITVREAQDGDEMRLGYAFLAPTGFHMVVRRADPAGRSYAIGNRIMLHKAPPVSGHRPSADVLFTSVAETYGHNSIGVILSGMGSDGASGIVAIKNAGGRTIVQDERSCVVFGMPKAAIETGVVDEILALGSIGERLVQLTIGN